MPAKPLIRRLTTASATTDQPIHDMPLVIIPILWGLLAYTAGSINWGYPVARRHGVDIVTEGTHNPGAANVLRVVGPLPGVIVYLADMLTATVVVAPTHWLPLSDTCMLVASGMVIMGTIFPVFSHFRGGTGLAKSTGVAAGINPLGLLLVLPLGLYVLRTRRNAAWAGVLGLGLVLLASAFISEDAIGVISIAMVGALIFIRSRVQYREGRNA